MNSHSKEQPLYICKQGNNVKVKWIIITRHVVVIELAQASPHNTLYLDWLQIIMHIGDQPFYVVPVQNSSRHHVKVSMMPDHRL